MGTTASLGDGEPCSRELTAHAVLRFKCLISIKSKINSSLTPPSSAGTFAPRLTTFDASTGSQLDRKCRDQAEHLCQN